MEHSIINTDMVSQCMSNSRMVSHGGECTTLTSPLCSSKAPRLSLRVAEFLEAWLTITRSSKLDTLSIHRIKDSKLVNFMDFIILFYRTLPWRLQRANHLRVAAKEKNFTAMLARKLL